VVVHPGEHRTTPDGRDLSAELSLGVRTWGNSATGSVQMQIGCYQLRSEIGQRLLSALPTTLLPSRDAWRSPLVGILADEMSKDEAGQEVVLNRLFDLLLITAVRARSTRAEADAPTWYRAGSDPVVGRALRLIHGNPAHPWTVAGLAREAGASRGAFAFSNAFKRVRGVSPQEHRVRG
jgi:AraC-like DNA-binding protein